jgi:O-antigen/teichoic acid export membrane protein
MSAVSNARWILLSQATRIGIQMVGLVVLSRLLPPAEYGLMAMASVVINFAYLLRDMGTAAAVVQKDKQTHHTTQTQLWLNGALGCSLAVGLVAFSPLIAEGFRTPALMPVLWVLALVFPVTSTAAVHQALLERESGFRLLARIEIISSLLGLAVALTLAWMNAGVYSLAYQTLVAALLSSLQLWFASAWRPKRRWSSEEFKSLWKFSGHLTGFSFINYFARNADSMVIGRVLGSIPLGIYSQAYKVMMFPLQSMTFVASRALFPIMSRQQNDRAQMARLYFRSLTLIATMTAPLMAGLWLLREPFVFVALGKQWAEVAGVLAWLAPVGFIQSLISTTGTVFMSTGRTDLLMRLGLIGTVLQVSAFFIGAHWGIEGVAICYLVANILNLFPCFFLTLRQLGCSAGELFNAVWKPIAFALVMCAILEPLLQLLSTGGAAALVTLLVPTCVGGLVFLILMLIFARTMVEDFKKLMGAR